jgi:hypothetical protein
VLLEFEPAGGIVMPAAGAGGLTVVTGAACAGVAAGAAGAAAGVPAAVLAGGLGM